MEGSICSEAERAFIYKPFELDYPCEYRHMSHFPRPWYQLRLCGIQVLGKRQMWRRRQLMAECWNVGSQVALEVTGQNSRTARISLAPAFGRNATAWVGELLHPVKRAVFG